MLPVYQSSIPSNSVVIGCGRHNRQHWHGQVQSTVRNCLTLPHQRGALNAELRPHWHGRLLCFWLNSGCTGVGDFDPRS